MANLSNINNFFVVEQTTGYVGIGITDPAFPLEVKSASAELALNATGGSIYRVISTASDEFIINKNGVGDRLTISGGGDATFSGNIIIGPKSNASITTSESGGATTKLISASVGRTGTYSNHEYHLMQNSAVAVTIDTNKNAIFAAPIWVSDYIYHTGDSNTYFGFSSNDTITFRTSGTERFYISSDGSSTFTGDVQATGIYIGSVNTSFDLYNNGTTYLNGATTIDDTLLVGATTITSATSMLLTLNPTAGSYGGILFQYGGVTKGASIYNSGLMVYGGEAGIATRLQAGGGYGLHMDYTNQNVHIGGTTNASQKLDVSGNIYATGRVQGDNSLIGSNTISSTNFATFGSNSSGVGVALARDWDASSYPDLIIHSSGAISVGTAVTPGRFFHIKAPSNFDGALKLESTNAASNYWAGIEFKTPSDDASIYIKGDDTSGKIYVNPSNSTKMIIGNETYIGGTSNLGYTSHNVQLSSPSGYALIVRNSDTSTTNNTVIQFNRAETTATTGGYFLIARSGDTNSGTNKLIIYANGNVENMMNSYGGLSDSRLKENIEDATPKLDDLMKVKIKNFNLKGNDVKQIGVIAQDLEQIFPGMVDNVKKPDSEDNTLYKSVKYSVFVPMLIKAIQELKAEIETLKTQINN